MMKSCDQRGLGALPSTSKMQSGARFALLANLKAIENAVLFVICYSICYNMFRGGGKLHGFKCWH
jgi:hypothetical protein